MQSTREVLYVVEELQIGRALDQHALHRKFNELFGVLHVTL
jgi:hypothetical protein